MSTWDTGDRSVEALYGHVLGRQADAGGLDYWKGQFGDSVDDNELGIFGAAAVPELSTNTPSWMGGGTVRGSNAGADGGNSFFNINTRTGYNPTYTNVLDGYGAEGGNMRSELSGYRSYTMPSDWSSGSDFDKMSLNGTQYTDYDINGKQIGTGTYDDITNRNHGWEIAKIFAAAAGTAGLQAAGVIGGTNPVLADAVTGAGVGGGTVAAGGDILSKAALDGTNIFGANSVPGALDISALSGAAPGLESQVALDGIVQGLQPTPEIFNAAKDSEAANKLLDGGQLPGVPGGPGTALEGYQDPTQLENLIRNPPVISNPPPIAPPPGGGTPTPPGTTPPPGTPPPGTNPPGIDIPGLGTISLSDLMKLLGGGIDLVGQRKASGDMLDYLKTQQAKVDNLYSPGSSEYNTLWDTMSRKDAAAGRMSQYGPRSVDLGARIAQIKADNTVRMTSGIGALYKNALDQEASAPAGLMAQLEGLFTNTPKT
jgi:hypothetical protein